MHVKTRPCISRTVAMRVCHSPGLCFIEIVYGGCVPDPCEGKCSVTLMAALL